VSPTTIAALSLTGFALAVLWHLGVRVTRPKPADPRQADNDTIRTAIQAAQSMAATLEQQAAADPTQAAVLLATVVRAQRPADELGASRSLLDALDQAAAYLREILPQPASVPFAHEEAVAQGIDCPECGVELPHHVPCGGPSRPISEPEGDEPTLADPPTWPKLTEGARQRLRASTFGPSDETDPAKSEDGAG
jgi:hypothetical protein